MPVMTEPDYYTVEEVAKRLRLHRSTIYRMLESGELRAIRIRNQFRIPPAAVEAIEGTPYEPAPEAD